MINIGRNNNHIVKRQAMARHDNERAKNVKQQGQHGPCKPYLAFSIDNILRRKEDGTAPNPTQAFFGNKAYAARTENENRREAFTEGTVDSTKITHLPWLSYTRYSPPKLPRSRRKLKNCKRRSSGSPRVPFSTSQLMSLEQKYTENHYLTGAQVTELARSLNLPQHRIKIWFQNRRAREKRSQEENPTSRVAEEYTPLPQQVEFKHITACYVPLSLSTNLSTNCFGLENYSHYKMLSRYVNMNGYSLGTLFH